MPQQPYDRVKPDSRVLSHSSWAHIEIESRRIAKHPTRQGAHRARLDRFLPPAVALRKIDEAR